MKFKIKYVDGYWRVYKSVFGIYFHKWDEDYGIYYNYFTANHARNDILKKYGDRVKITVDSS